jgi:RimJ/RimL family protein N-acetyltransferase
MGMKREGRTSSNWQPHLVGELLELRPLRPEDWAALFAVAADPLIWEQHPARDRYQEDVFRDFFEEALACGGAFAVLDRKTQAVIGSSRYFGYDPAKREIEIGWTFLARRYWGGEFNGEMKRLMLDHAFRFVERVIFLIGPDNLRSRRAVEKIGAVYAGRREKTDRHGNNVVSVVYEITKSAYWRSPLMRPDHGHSRTSSQ